ncbi:hypothetical protein RAJCM14343_5419 [Rhodococcus aetherivorans]|uniref:Uncharacterized protein n=1 Tax=Rhodococcus aetherivorans TaxID=191292 RepID=A0ABQ0YUH3_9NOCA|nr:hypothetical protein RAJCM14343_5419 [Rhodococcus aetherivorans]CCW10975.1 hypothetical protein EBESD8_15090 [Rhodococcus aetherivorans]
MAVDRFNEVWHRTPTPRSAAGTSLHGMRSWSTWKAGGSRGTRLSRPCALESSTSLF